MKRKQTNKNARRLEECPVCGVAYGEFRTGFNYEDIRTMLWSASSDPSTWVYKRRNTILGKWFQIKQKMWAEHLETCEVVGFEKNEAAVHIEY